MHALIATALSSQILIFPLLGSGHLFLNGPTDRIHATQVNSLDGLISKKRDKDKSFKPKSKKGTSGKSNKGGKEGKGKDSHDQKAPHDENHEH